MLRVERNIILLLVLVVFLVGPPDAYSYLAGDLNQDRIVDSKDLRIFSWEWLHLACLVPGCIADLDGVDGVNMADLALLAGNWQVIDPHLVINEFMAESCGSSIQDATGEPSDWIEIYNPTIVTINLDGWSLTNDADDLIMWQFPNGLQIKAGEFLIVFASEKTYEDNPYNYPYVDSHGYYHTNFKLDESGGYLALVSPFPTVVHEYSPTYPPQLTDVSYGLMQYAATLVPSGATASYHVPDSNDAAVGTGWTTTDFNDSEWNTGPTGLGFGIGPKVAYNDCVYLSSDQYIADNVTTYGIGIGNPGLSSGPLIDKATGDDMGITVTLVQSGGVMWQPEPNISGSDCAVGTDAYNTFSGIADMTGVIAYGGTGWWVDLTFTGLDPATEYTFATSANRGEPNSDYPYRWTIYTLSGADTYTNASTPGVDVMAENQVSFSTGYNFNEGYVARWTGITAADGSFTVRAEANPASYDGRRAYSFDVFMLEGGVSRTDVQADMSGVNASLWIRTEFDLEEPPEIFDSLILRKKYEDGFAAYLNGHPVTWRNSPDPGILQWNSTALANRPLGDSSVFDEINLSAYLDLLHVGRNVLAIHGLNDHKDNGEFLILPELVAAAYGRVPQYLPSPTPGTFNGAGVIGRVSEVWFSHKRGFYDSPFQLTLSTGTEGALIRYTTDGSRPTISHGYTYTSPLDVAWITTIRAIAIKPVWLDSKVETHTYIFLDYVIHQPTHPMGWPNADNTINGQVLDYEMDPNVVNAPPYADLVDDALLSIPTISLVTDMDNLFDPSMGIYVNAGQVDDEDYDDEPGLWERPTSVELINPGGSEGFQIDAGLRIRGGFDRNGSNPKHAFRLSLRCEYGQRELQFPLFGNEGVDEFKSVDLRTAQAYSWSFIGDARNTMVRDVFSRDLQGQMGHPYTRSRYYHLYINGLYWGIYQTQEHCTAWYAESYLSDDEDDDDDDDDFEASGYDEDDYDIITSAWSEGRRMVATEGTPDAFYRLYYETMTGFDNFSYYRVQGLNIDGTPNPNYERLLDVDNLIDFMIIEYYTGNRDGPGSRYGGRPNNTWGIYNRENPDGFKWLQHESEHSLGTGDENMVLPFTTAGASINYFNPHFLHEQLAIQNAEYRLHFADHVHRHFFNDGLLTLDESRNRIQNRANQIDMAIIAESARWGDSKREPPFTKNNYWLGEIDRILNYSNGRYLVNRVEVVLDQFKSVGWYPNVNAPVFYINGSYQHGGQVSAGDDLTMNNPNGSGTIWYTIDGSDPRQPVTGNVIGTKYSNNPVTLTKSTHVKARVRDGGTWSALCEAIFAVGPVAENLRITEIMYHPRYQGNPSNPNEEYIELTNIGPNTINLNLVRFTEGIDFTFPDMELEANEHVVVVKDLIAFENQYGTSVNIAGQYTGELLDDAGEQIRLEDANGRTILDFDYSGEWYPITDGDGFSLTIIDPTDSAMYGWDQGLVAHWKFDDGSGGTAIDSAGTNNGTLNGDPNWTTGRIGGALSFDGAGDYVVAASVAPLTGDTLTAQAWIRTSEYAGIWNPIITQNAGANGYYFLVSSSSPAFYLAVGASFVQAISPEAINADQWYHVAGTNDGSNMKLYIDGKLQDSAASTGFLGVSGNINIGCEPVSPLYYYGLIDDVRIYNRAVSELEFQAGPMGRWSEKESWRPSVIRNGTPGWDDSGILPNPGAIVINEVMANSYGGQDWIELHNTTGYHIDIGGWFLSAGEVDADDDDDDDDDDDNDADISSYFARNNYEVGPPYEPDLMKYRIANGTTINPNEYILFHADTDFNNPGDPGCLVPFTISANGGWVSLSSRLDPNSFLTGYRQVQVFGASQQNVSFGRHYKSSTNTFDFVAMDSDTPDANNGPPKVGPVVINEIMYNPPTGYQNEEYIELHNITGALVALYRYDKLAPWKFTDGIDYTFPPGPPVTIPPYGYLLLVKDVAAFTAQYGSMPPGVQVLGNYAGLLSNDSGEVELSMPGDVDWWGTRYYILVDRIDYSDGLHPEDCPGGVDLWPTEADGLGKSLSRKNSNDYGNDVANWKAAAPSPGAANP